MLHLATNFFGGFFANMIKLGAANFGSANYFNFFHQRRIYRKNSFHSHAFNRPPHRKSGARFFAMRFKEIEAAYIGPGLVKFYHKPALSRQDVEAKSANYRRAAALHCAAQMQSDKYWGFFFSIQNASLDGLVPAAEAAGFSGPAFEACLESDLPALREAMAETETFGIMTLPTLYLDVRGISPRVFRGVPPPGQLRQAMRAYELMMGR